ncbi:surf-like protein [Pichia californica]|nr:surf-like protein [[Candida] californica]
MLGKFKVGRLGAFSSRATAQSQRPYASAKTANIDWNPIRSKKQLKQGIEFDGSASRKVFFGLLCLAPIITFALGTWQTRRLKWKNKLIAECEDRLTYKPIPLPKNLTKEDMPNLEYRKVLVTGHFDYSREAFVGPRLHDTHRGYTLVCPFIQSNGDGEVLIDRGWISADKVIPSSRNLQHLSVPKGEITVECVIRVPPQKGVFNIDHDKNSRLYQYLDVEAIASEMHSRPLYLQALQNYHDRPEWASGEDLSQVKENANDKTKSWAFWKQKSKPITESTSSISKPSLGYDTAEEFDPLQFINAGVPLGKIPKVDYKNNHLNYLVTWYSLSVASSVLLIYMFRKGKFMNPTEEKLKYAKKIAD